MRLLLYIERRATPAKEKGVQGMPMIASAFPTNPSLNGELGWKSAMDRKQGRSQHYGH